MKHNSINECDILAKRFVPPLLTLTELLAITVTTLSPPTITLKAVAIPKALRSLFTFDLLFCGSSLSTALILNNDSMLEISVIEKTVDKKGSVKAIPKSGVGKSDQILSGREINRFEPIGYSCDDTKS